MVCFFAVTEMKTYLRYDDSLDVFGVHCMGSVVGMLFLGFHGQPGNPIRRSPRLSMKKRGGGFAGRRDGAIFGTSASAYGLTRWRFATAAGTFIILKKVVDVVITACGWTRKDDRSVGLDLSQHMVNGLTTNEIFRETHRWKIHSLG